MWQRHVYLPRHHEGHNELVRQLLHVLNANGFFVHTLLQHGVDLLGR